MKTVIKGKLGNKPKLREIETAKGEKFKAVNFTLYVVDPTKKNDTGYMTTVPFRMTAYNERAEKISQMEPGTTITGIADLRSRVLEDEKTVVPVWNLTKIDETNKLAEQQTKLLSAYTKGDIAAIDIGLSDNFVPLKETEASLPFEPSNEKEMED